MDSTLPPYETLHSTDDSPTHIEVFAKHDDISKELLHGHLLSVEAVVRSKILKLLLHELELVLELLEAGFRLCQEVLYLGSEFVVLVLRFLVVFQLSFELL